MAILIQNSTNFECLKEIKDSEGRYIIVKGKLQEEMVTLINAPLESTKQFFKSLFSVMALESEGIVICAGDFNMIMDHRVDTTSTKRNETHLDL